MTTPSAIAMHPADSQQVFRTVLEALARPGMLLPRRPRQSRARHHVRAEDITEIAALSHAEVLRPIPARRFLEGNPETLSVAH